MNKTLAIMWLVVAAVNLLGFIALGDFDDLTIAALEVLLAWDHYEDYKRKGA
jgi:hypothetical protein